ncbi:alpha/beta fold hydrolase [Halodurantibacterium flavum]|uniref:Alpha/beta fold hydrolase n=1 Tax=Halodurantibacterium flavum TaxID=1382802 RepID=A0ABW4S7K1_9RHOB
MPLTAVLIPGLVSDARVWRPLARALPDAVALHDADLRAMTSITGAAERLLSLIDGDLLLAGHSMGGRIAQEMARIAPDRMRGLILANTGHNSRREGEEPKRQAMIELGHSGMDRLTDQWLPPMLDPARTDDAALVADLRAMVLAATPDQHERQIRALLDRPDAMPHLGAIPCPVLLLTGRQDGWSPAAQHQEMADRIPDAELALIDNAGHFAPVERPEAVVAAAMDWITRKVPA